MAGDDHGVEEMQDAQAQEDLGQQQAAQEQPQVSGTDWEKAVAERDEKIAALDAQVAEAAKNAEVAERLRGHLWQGLLHDFQDRFHSCLVSPITPHRTEALLELGPSLNHLSWP